MPVILTEVPTAPDVGDRPVMLGGEEVDVASLPTKNVSASMTLPLAIWSDRYTSCLVPALDGLD